MATALDFEVNEQQNSKEDLAATLERLCANGTIESLIERALERVGTLESSSFGYLHVNDFRKLVLLQGGKAGGEIRLHEWLPSSGLELDRHNHPWNFASCILAGELVNQIFVETFGSTHCRTVIGPVGNDTDGYHYIGDGVTGITCITESKLCAGSFYSMEHHLIHNAFSPRGGMTLMIQGPFIREVSLSFRPINAGPRPEGMRSLSNHEVGDMLERALVTIRR